MDALDLEWTSVPVRRYVLGNELTLLSEFLAYNHPR